MAGKQKFVQIQDPETLCRPYAFARRMSKTPKSFIREILKVTENPGIISFAGGLPSPDLIDVGGIADAAAAVLRKDGRTALQYSTTEGYLPLRRFIADRYKKRLGLDVSPDEILITNGSQQCLDLIGKILIDPVTMSRSNARVSRRNPGILALRAGLSCRLNLRARGRIPAAFEAALDGI